MTTQTTIGLLQQQMETLADTEYARFAAALLPGMHRRLIGVRLPVLRKLAKDWVKGRSMTDIEVLFHPDTFEEVLFLGFVIGYSSLTFPERWALILRFVPFIDNWSVCDSCCATFTAVRQHREHVWPDLVRCLESQEEFRQRFAVVMLLDHFICEECIIEVLDLLRITEPHGYYVEMAIGWALSVAALTFPEPTLSVIRDEKVPVACRKKACQKIMESLRSSEKLRTEIKKIRTKI